MRVGETDGGQVKIIITALGVIMFFALVSSGYRAIKMNNPEVLENCVSDASLVLINNSGVPVASQDDAESALEGAISMSASFLHNTVEVCDVQYSGYVYKSEDNTTYAVCGDGKIYQYQDRCGKTGQWDSLATTFKNVNPRGVALPKDS